MMKGSEWFGFICLLAVMFLFGFAVGVPSNKPKPQLKTEMQLFTCPEGHVCTFECSKDGYRFDPCGPYIRKVIQ